MTCGGLCEHAAQVSAVPRVRHPGASDSVHRQSAGHVSSATVTGAHSANQTVQKTVEIPQVQVGEVGRARRCATTGARNGPDSVDNRGGAAVAVYRRGRRHFCCGAEATPGLSVRCCEHAAASSSSPG